MLLVCSSEWSFFNSLWGFITVFNNIVTPERESTCWVREISKCGFQICENIDFQLKCKGTFCFFLHVMAEPFSYTFVASAMMIFSDLCGKKVHFLSSLHLYLLTLATTIYQYLFYHRILKGIVIYMQ